ncbi:MAG: pyridine nucleotide-disulfide oxidoreductase [Nevskiaceae bacterium]|nr:MAG: pyridine nucleotide-disulfide oxidoreductase [Nevskiaceae bacterium]TBR71625.1 MAG: pyridine nucleotide-disulfide oxidoreductase [Nevskiaceae bacterium]
MADPSQTPVFAIVGAGQAGAELAKTLRKRGFGGHVLLLGDEPHLPYRRPPLSKAYLAGKAAPDSFVLIREAQLEKERIEYVRGVRVEKIDRATRTLHLSNGQTRHYDKLALTTGGRPRPLPLEGANGDNVFALRRLVDVDRLRPELQAGRRVVIVGGGFIGLEVAAVLGKLGLEVTVLEGLPRVLSRVTGEEMSAFYEHKHRSAGVDLRTGAKLAGFVGAPRVTAVKLDDGTEIPADVVLVGIGQLPNVELAQDAGVKVDNGIVVDEYAQSSDPDIVAAGDCANFPNRLYGRRLRLESVQNAMDQSRVAAATMMGAREAYDALPWFWSDQYDLKLQMAGLSAGYDAKVVRGKVEDGTFAVFYLKDGVVISADMVNRGPEFGFAKKLIVTRAKPDVQRLADVNVPLKELVPEA